MRPLHVRRGGRGSTPALFRCFQFACSEFCKHWESEYYSHPFQICNILNKIINAPCGTLKLLLALGVEKYIKSYKIHFVQYATDYCPLEHGNYKTTSAHLGSPISCYINNLHGAFIFLLSVHFMFSQKWQCLVYTRINFT